MDELYKTLATIVDLKHTYLISSQPIRGLRDLPNNQSAIIFPEIQNNYEHNAI
jgi:hypothetical protein